MTRHKAQDATSILTIFLVLLTLSATEARGRGAAATSVPMSPPRTGAPVPSPESSSVEVAVHRPESAGSLPMPRPVNWTALPMTAVGASA